MNKLIITLAAIAMFLSSAVAQAGVQDFTLVNNTGLAIHYVYVSATISQDWEEDLLGNEILYNGEQLQVSFTGGSNHCYWDLKVLDQNQNPYDWRNIDLCSYSQITLVMENGRIQAYYR